MATIKKPLFVAVGNDFINAEVAIFVPIICYPFRLFSPCYPFRCAHRCRSVNRCRSRSCYPFRCVPVIRSGAPIVAGRVPVIRSPVIRSGAPIVAGRLLSVPVCACYPFRCAHRCRSPVIRSGVCRLFIRLPVYLFSPCFVPLVTY